MAPALSAAHACSEGPVLSSRRSQLAARRVSPQDGERGDLAGSEGAFGNILNTALIGSLLTLIVGLLILAGFAVSYFESSAEVTTTMNDPNVTTGDTRADNLKPTFGFVIAIVLLLAFVSAILAFAKIRAGNG